jgi:hypothetical protein
VSESSSNEKEPEMKQVRRPVAISIAIALMLCATAAFAQMEELRNSTPQQRAKLETAFMKMKLNLSRQQMERVLNINLKYAQQMDPIIKGNEGKLRKVRDASAINRAKDRDLQTVLSGDQYQAYLASKEEMRQRMVEKFRQKQGISG